MNRHKEASQKTTIFHIFRWLFNRKGVFIEHEFDIYTFYFQVLHKYFRPHLLK